jgi:hypothetical protein
VGAAMMLLRPDESRVDFLDFLLVLLERFFVVVVIVVVL